MNDAKLLKLLLRLFVRNCRTREEIVRQIIALVFPDGEIDERAYYDYEYDADIALQDELLIDMEEEEVTDEFVAGVAAKLRAQFSPPPRAEDSPP